MIQHIVLLKLKPDATTEQKAALLAGLIALQEAPFYGALVLSEAIEHVVKVGAIYKRREGLMNGIARDGASISQPETHIVGGFHLSLLPAFALASFAFFGALAFFPVPA